MSDNIHKLPGALSDEELLAELDPQAPAIHAAREERLERYGRLSRDCEARRTRQGFKVVD